MLYPQQNDCRAGLRVWNLADFRTAQAILRAGSLNHKDVFTRDRQPKWRRTFSAAGGVNPTDFLAVASCPTLTFQAGRNSLEGEHHRKATLCRPCNIPKSS